MRIARKTLPLQVMLALVAALWWITGCSTAAPAPAAAPTAPGQVHVAPPTASAVPALGSQQGNDLVIVLTGNPASPIRGRNVLDALITDAAGRPVTDAQVSFDLDMTTMSHGLNIVPAQPTGNGHYAGQVSFMMPGPWRVIAVIERPDKPVERIRFDLNVKQK
jgi:hypothetical protein